MEKQKKSQNVNSSEESSLRIEELSLVEQSLQNLMMQKQVFQMELVEVTNALEELKKLKSGEEVFKIVGSLMIKSNKDETEKELAKKRDLLNLRIMSIEKQEEDLKKKLLSMREEVLKTFKK